MKKLIIGFVSIIVVGNACLAQTNFYTNITNLWSEARKDEVLAIANVRLAQNTNDIAGLILKAEYLLEFLEADGMSNAFLRVIQVGDSITTTNFVNDWQNEVSRESILEMLDLMVEYPITPQMIQEDRPKAFRKYKRMTYGSLIEALQKDGYFD